MTLNQARHNLTKILNRIYGRDMLDEETINELEEIEDFLIQEHQKEEKKYKSIYSIKPVVCVEDLEHAVNLQYGVDLDLRDLLFSDSKYINFDFNCMEIFAGASWQNEERIREINLVKTYLQDTLPDFTEVIIDLSW